MKLLFFAALIALPRDDAADVVRKAIAKTAAGTYAYKVSGRAERAGEFKPETVLTARLGKFQSVRNGAAVLVKGPDGMWKTPAERLEELTPNRDRESIEIVAALRDADAPHRILADLFTSFEAGRKVDAKTVGGRRCAGVEFPLARDALRTAVERQLERAVERKEMAKPDEIKWGTLKGAVRVYVDKKEDVLVRVEVERSVTIVYKDTGAGDHKLYRNDLLLEFSDHGKAAVVVPDEVKKRLSLGE